MFGRMHMIAITAAGGLALVVAAYGYGRWDGALRCNAAALQSEIDTLRADLRIAQNAERLALRQAEEMKELASNVQGRVDEIIASVEDRPESERCRLSDADLRRLQSIAPGPRTSPAR